MSRSTRPRVRYAAQSKCRLRRWSFLAGMTARAALAERPADV
jgi:hypothetical protein